jgi:hypothetical protein
MYLRVSCDFLDKQHIKHSVFVMETQGIYFDIATDILLQMSFRLQSIVTLNLSRCVAQLCNAFHTRSYHSQATSSQLPHDKFAMSATKQISTAIEVAAAKECQRM